MATGKPLRTNLFIGGWTALAIWQYLRCTGRPRLDQPHTVTNLLVRAGIKAKSRVPFSGAPSCRDPWETILPAVEGVAGSLRSVSLKMPGTRSIPRGGANGIVANLPNERPVDLLVDAPSRRRNSSSFHCRVWGRELPPASFLMLGPHIYLSRPEFVFLQLAAELPLVDLALLGCEILGFYALDRMDVPGSTRCHPLTTADSLIRFLKNIPPGMRGAARAACAAGFAVERSASTGETAMALLLSVPRTRGGYGLPAPRMNARVEVPAKLRELLGGSHLMCDTFWPQARFALEYNGRAEHEGDVAEAHDRERAGRLQAIGVRMETVTAFELARATAFDKVARRVAHGIGRRLFSRDYGSRWHRQRNELREKVIGGLFGDACGGGDEV